MPFLISVRATGLTSLATSTKSPVLALTLSGLYPYEGSILVNGREFRTMDADERAALISYIEEQGTHEAK